MVFRNSIEPAFCVTFEVDITNFLPQIKQQNKTPHAVVAFGFDSQGNLLIRDTGNGYSGQKQALIKLGVDKTFKAWGYYSDEANDEYSLKNQNEILNHLTKICYIQ